MAALILIRRVNKYDAAFLTMLLVGLLLVAIAQIGERLRWWNDLGEWATLLGLALSAASIAAAILWSATKSEVRVVGGDVRFVGDEVRRVREEVHRVGEGVASANTKLDRTNVKLDQANTKLDQANTKLDGSNAALHSIIGLLTDIRDRLPGRERTRGLRPPWRGPPPAGKAS